VAGFGGAIAYREATTACMVTAAACREAAAAAGTGRLAAHGSLRWLVESLASSPAETPMESRAARPVVTPAVKALVSPVARPRAIGVP
jgi:hypothetical protein